MVSTAVSLVSILSSGGVAVIPTDTIYGLVCSALNQGAVERIYRMRKRETKKPMIILISSLSDLAIFDLHPDSETKSLLSKLWPNPISVILPCRSNTFRYLHRGTNALAFRMPKDNKLLTLLSKTGPLVAPSANIQGQNPAETVKEAQSYFHQQVDKYIDGGKVKAQASTLVEFQRGKLRVLREGPFNPLPILLKAGMG